MITLYKWIILSKKLHDLHVHNGVVSDTQFYITSAYNNTSEQWMKNLTIF